MPSAPEPSWQPEGKPCFGLLFETNGYSKPPALIEGRMGGEKEGGGGPSARQGGRIRVRQCLAMGSEGWEQRTSSTKAKHLWLERVV